MCKPARRLNLSHGLPECDGPVVPDSLFLTGEYTLLVAGHCAECGVALEIEIPIEQLIFSCPAPSGSHTSFRRIVPGDLEFLRALHIVPDLEA